MGRRPGGREVRWGRRWWGPGRGYRSAEEEIVLYTLTPASLNHTVETPGSFYHCFHFLFILQHRKGCPLYWFNFVGLTKNGSWNLLA